MVAIEKRNMWYC